MGHLPRPSEACPSRLQRRMGHLPRPSEACPSKLQRRMRTPFIIHHSSFIIHHSSFIIPPPSRPEGPPDSAQAAAQQALGHPITRPLFTRRSHPEGVREITRQPQRRHPRRQRHTSHKSSSPRPPFPRITPDLKPANVRFVVPALAGIWKLNSCKRLPNKLPPGTLRPQSSRLEFSCFEASAKNARPFHPSSFILHPSSFIIHHSPAIAA